MKKNNFHQSKNDDFGALSSNNGVFALVISILAAFSVIGILIWLIYELIKAIWHAIIKKKNNKQNKLREDELNIN